MMRIVRTTDNRHLGQELPVLNTDTPINLNGFLFEVQSVKTLENGNTLLSNPNYQIECEEL
jgi:hypothetical protein